MSTITEDYVSFETAKLLKEKGFYSEDCFAFYKENGEIGFLQTFGDITDYDSETCVIAPTLQMAMKWLRKMHDVFISITYEKWDVVFIADVKSPVSGIDCWVDNKHNCWFKYEEAAEEAIKFCLERII